MAIKHTEQTEIREWARPKSGCQTNRTDSKTRIAQTEHTEGWFCPDQTDRNTGINQTEQTEK